MTNSNKKNKSPFPQKHPRADGFARVILIIFLPYQSRISQGLSPRKGYVKEFIPKSWNLVKSWYFTMPCPFSIVRIMSTRKSYTNHCSTMMDQFTIDNIITMAISMDIGQWTEWVICNFFWYLCCFRQGFMRVTLRNKNNICRSYMVYVYIFQRFLTFVLYNYTLQFTR